MADYTEELWAMDTSATVNPADLSAIDIFDVSMYMDPFDQTLEPTAPVTIPGRQASLSQSLPKHSRVSLLSTSPPDIGWQWGYDPMTVRSPARRPSQGQLATSRNASEASMQQLSSGLPTPQRLSRGKLLAVASTEGPETVFEDSDSHHSWTNSDNLETWCDNLRERLADFRRCKERVVIITSVLQTRQRRKVHSMANLLGLSHMSLGSGRRKQILISKCELQKSASVANAAREKRWNPVRNNWSRGMVDPRVVVIEGLASGESIARFQQHLANASLPCPQSLVMEYAGSSIPAQQMEPLATAYACFETPDDAATVLLALDHTTPNWNAANGDLECDYVHFSPGTDIDYALAHFESLPQLLKGETPLQHTTGDISFVSHSTDYALYSDSETEEHHLSPGLTMPLHRFSSRKVSNDSSHSRDAGYASGGSVLSQMLSDQSDGSATKKRKRMPKIVGGFACSFTTCDKVFNRDGDRRKHEKNHSGERKYVCERCGRGFLFPKDLKRHVATHAVQPMVPESASGALPSSWLET